MREGEENGSGLDSERFHTPAYVKTVKGFVRLYCICWISGGFRSPASLRTVKGFVRRIYRVSHRHSAGVRARWLNRRRLASGLGTVLQPATRVPSLRHSGFNGTNDNRHPCLRRSFADVQSANPSLHSSIQLKNNVPENTKRKKTKLYLISCLILGSKSSGNRMFPLGEEAPGMAHADPSRRWHLG